MTKLTVVFLHVGPKVSFLYAVSKRAIPNVLTLLASSHVHANLRKKNNIWQSLMEICLNQNNTKNKQPWSTAMFDTYLKLRWDGFFGWKWSNRCPLFPFMGTNKHHSPIFCPPETERQKLSL